MTPPDGFRISDTDRISAMEELGRHYAEGRLDHDEYDERLDAAGTARTRLDLDVLFEDLPAPVQARLTPDGRRTDSPVRRQRRGPHPWLLVGALLALAVIAGAPWLAFVAIGAVWFTLGRRGSCARGHQGKSGYDPRPTTR